MLATLVLCLVLGPLGLVAAGVIIIFAIIQSCVNGGAADCLEEKLKITEEKITILDDFLK